jgi:Ca2+-dependent lipid-binding protein
MNKTCSLRNNEIKFIFSYFYVFFFVTSFIFLQCIKYYNENLLKFKEELENEKNKNKCIKDKNNWFLDNKIE